MAWYAKEFGLNQFQDLTNEFETETLIPFEKYQSSIFEPDTVEARIQGQGGVCTR